nr:hypothetical protein CFP56_56544 [Quercus suber]
MPAPTSLDVPATTLVQEEQAHELVATPDPTTLDTTASAATQEEQPLESVETPASTSLDPSATEHMHEEHARGSVESAALASLDLPATEHMHEEQPLESVETPASTSLDPLAYTRNCSALLTFEDAMTHLEDARQEEVPTGGDAESVEVKKENSDHVQVKKEQVEPSTSPRPRRRDTTPSTPPPTARGKRAASREPVDPSTKKNAVRGTVHRDPPEVQQRADQKYAGTRQRYRLAKRIDNIIQQIRNSNKPRPFKGTCITGNEP